MSNNNFPINIQISKDKTIKIEHKKCTKDLTIHKLKHLIYFEYDNLVPEIDN